MTHRSSPARAGTQPTLSVLRLGVGNPASSGFRASRRSLRRNFHGFRSGAPLRGYAPSLSPFRSRLFALLRSPPSFGGLFRNLASVRHTPPAPALCGSLPRLCISFTGAYPHVFRYKKRGRSPAPS